MRERKEKKNVKFKKNNLVLNNVLAQYNAMR